MSTHKKTRGDSVLGTLTEDRQAEIADYARAHTFAKTCEWLKADGIKISQGSLSNWLSAWELRCSFKQADERTLQFIEMLSKVRPSMPQSELDEWGATYFQTQAIARNDPDTFLAYASAREKAKHDSKRLAQRDRALEFDQKKFAAGLKTKIEHGLDALYEEIKGNAEARALFEKFKSVVTKATA